MRQVPGEKKITVLPKGTRYVRPQPYVQRAMEIRKRMQREAMGKIIPDYDPKPGKHGK